MAEVQNPSEGMSPSEMQNHPGAKNPSNVIEFYPEFECLGGECPYTCCRGWQIPVGEETLLAWKQGTAATKALYPLLMTHNSYGISVLRQPCGRCLFHTKEQLCSLQKKGEEQLMPKVCRLFPRNIMTFPDRQEVTLELSCIKAAQLFLEHPGRLTFRPISETFPTVWEAPYPEPDFMSFLYDLRDRLLDHLWGTSDLRRSVYDIYTVSYRLHTMLAADHLGEASKLLAEIFPCTDNAVGPSTIPVISDEPGTAPFYPLRFLNKLIYQLLDLTRIHQTNSVIDDLLTYYKKEYGKLSEIDAEALFRQRIDALYQKYPDLENMLRSYYSYLLQQTLLQAAEDYYLLRPILLSTILTEFLQLFLVLADQSGQELNRPYRAILLTHTEKALAHNPNLSDAIMDRIRTAYF